MIKNHLIKKNKSINLDINDYKEFDVVDDYVVLARDAKDLKLLYQEVTELIEQSGEKIINIDENIIHSLDNTEKGTEMVIHASNDYKKTRYLKLILLSTLVGGIIGLPVGGILGAGISASITGFAALSGITTGSIIGLRAGSGLGTLISSIFGR